MSDYVQVHKILRFCFFFFTKPGKDEVLSFFSRNAYRYYDQLLSLTYPGCLPTTASTNKAHDEFHSPRHGNHTVRTARRLPPPPHGIVAKKEESVLPIE